MRSLAATGLLILLAGCGARTEGLLDDEPGAPFDPFADAHWEDVTFSDGAPGDTGSFPDEGLTIDTGAVVDAIAIDSPAFDAGPPSSPGCPSGLPKDGSPCGTSKLACFYGGCDPKASDRADCAGSGVWTVRAASCLTASDRCPVATPVNGTPCTLPPGGELCWYSKLCDGHNPAQCDSRGLWLIKGGSCGDTSRCPTTRPAPGAPCPSKGSKDYFLCYFPNACGIDTDIACDGSTGTWQPSHDEACTAGPGCPAAAPPIGSPCPGTPTYLDCAWPNACGSIDHMDCVSGGTWRMFHRGACADATCPDPAKDGAPCSDEGKACTYPIGGGCALVCTCESGAYACKQPPCGA